MSDNNDPVHYVLGLSPLSSYSDDDVRRRETEMKIILEALEKEDALKPIVDTARAEIDDAVAHHFNKTSTQSATLPEVSHAPMQVKKPPVLAEPYWPSVPPSNKSEVGKSSRSARRFNRRVETDELDSETKTVLWLVVAVLVMIIPLKFIQDATPVKKDDGTIITTKDKEPNREETGVDWQTAPSNAVAPSDRESQNPSHLDRGQAPFAWLGNLIVQLINWAAMPLLVLFLLSALLGARFTQRIVRSFITVACDLTIWSLRHVIWPILAFMATAVKSITAATIARLPQQTNRVLAIVVVSILALMMLIVFVFNLVGFLQK